MPFRSKSQPKRIGRPPGPVRKCKYCDQPARHNITSSGRNKGWLRTCGTEECLSHRHKASKKPRSLKMCETCDALYLPRSARQRWCQKCVPDRTARQRMRLYGITQVQYEKMWKKQSGLCAVCDGLTDLVVDHDHETGDVRGLVCFSCNLLLAALDRPEWVEKARKYLGGKE